MGLMNLQTPQTHCAAAPCLRPGDRFEQPADRQLAMSFVACANFSLFLTCLVTLTEGAANGTVLGEIVLYVAIALGKVVHNNGRGKHNCGGVVDKNGKLLYGALIKSLIPILRPVCFHCYHVLTDSLTASPVCSVFSCWQVNNPRLSRRRRFWLRSL